MAPKQPTGVPKRIGVEESAQFHAELETKLKTDYMKYCTITPPNDEDDKQAHYQDWVKHAFPTALKSVAARFPVLKEYQGEMEERLQKEHALIESKLEREFEDYLELMAPDILEAKSVAEHKLDFCEVRSRGLAKEVLEEEYVRDAGGAVCSEVVPTIRKAHKLE